MWRCIPKDQICFPGGSLATIDTLTVVYTSTGSTNNEETFSYRNRLLSICMHAAVPHLQTGTASGIWAFRMSYVPQTMNKGTMLSLSTLGIIQFPVPQSTVNMCYPLPSQCLLVCMSTLD